MAVDMVAHRQSQLEHPQVAKISDGSWSVAVGEHSNSAVRPQLSGLPLDARHADMMIKHRPHLYKQGQVACSVRLDHSMLL